MDHLDHNTVLKIQGRMMTATRQLNEMAPKAGHARQIRDFTSERRKNLIAKYADTSLSFAMAEVSARKHPAYLQEFEDLAQQHEDAETTIAQWTALQASFEAARSLLSFNRESLRQLEG